MYDKKYVKIITTDGGINQVPQCVRKVSFGGVKISCQHLEF